MKYGSVYHGYCKAKNINLLFKGTDHTISSDKIPILYDFDLNDSAEIFKVKCRYNEIAHHMAYNGHNVTFYDGIYPLTPKNKTLQNNLPVLKSYIQIIKSLSGKPSNISGYVSTYVSTCMLAYCIHNKEYDFESRTHDCELCHDLRNTEYDPHHETY